MAEISSIRENQAVENNNKPSVGKRIGGYIAGNTACNLAQAGTVAVVTPKIAEGMYKLSTNLSADEFQKVADATQKAFDISGLANQGVEIVKAGKDTASSIAVREILEAEVQKNPVARFLPKAVKDMQLGNMQATVADGKNAFYAMATNKIVMPKDNKLPLAAFHEMGHAMNSNFGSVSKVLQKCRSLSILAVPILTIALLKDKKKDGEKPEGALDKATTFIKDNAGKLAFASWLPTILEEGIATGKGNSLAKKVLSPELAKKVAKGNAYGLATYVAMAAAVGLGTFAAKTIRDNIVQGKEK